ncbi:gp45 [Salisaeta icosahedral phage 1]|uniref:gp45 n=1 Tax=Salisaeta icosahedral phage 1 TaxID=1183239 RepID=UPI00025EA93A|nr:gp45 [Salisaeta icosahedral phage 1]AFJ21500.1 gp45 [Salisaeta icosahedral phage 1]
MRAAIAPENYTPAFPIAKSVPIRAQDRLRTIRDHVPLTQEEFQGDTISLFNSNPNRDKILRNYTDNPLPYNIRKRIVGMGFRIDPIVVEAATGVDPEALINSLAHVGVKLTRDQNAKTVMRYHIKQLMNFNQVHLVTAAFNDGTNSGSKEAAIFLSTPIVRLPDADQLTLKPDERFDLELKFDDKTGIPAAADWSGTIGAFLQITHEPTG